jgi:L-threonylcarbamoyladenylate synthase
VIASAALDGALATLRGGGVVAAATETFFGLLADATRSSAIDLVARHKGRELGRGIALLLPGRGAWDGLVSAIPNVATRLADAFWPGPLTIALPARGGLDPRLIVDGTVAVRLAGPSDAAALAAAFGGPLTATSANRTGEPPAVTDDDVRRSFGGEIHVVRGTAPGGAPSTIVRIEGESVRVLRQGAVSRTQLGRLAVIL